MSLDTSSVMICTPCYGGQASEMYTQSLWRTMMHLMVSGIGIECQTLRNESLITRARNILVADFMAKPRFDYLMFIDADIGWEPYAVLELMAWQRDVVCGAYPKKQLPINYVMNGPQKQEDSLIKVKDAGTGFMLIHRSVFEKMFKAYPELKIRPHIFDNKEDQFPPEYIKAFTDNYYALFDTVIDDGRYLSEDYAFCRRWQNIGGDIFIDPNIKLDHIGTYVFTGELKKLESLMEETNGTDNSTKSI